MYNEDAKRKLIESVERLIDMCNAIEESYFESNRKKNEIEEKMVKLKAENIELKNHIVSISQKLEKLGSK